VIACVCAFDKFSIKKLLQLILLLNPPGWSTRLSVSYSRLRPADHNDRVAWPVSAGFFSSVRLAKQEQGRYNRVYIGFLVSTVRSSTGKTGRKLRVRL